MAKLTSYIVAIIGLVVIALSFFKISFLSSIKPIYMMMVGVIIIIIGLTFFSEKKKHKQESEVPIYEGTGKHRRIVGYRREK